MTYRQLIERLQCLHPSQLECDVTVRIDGEDEYYAVTELRIADTNVLDPDHPVLYVE